MILSQKLQDGPIAALATPLGTSALALIRLSGEGIVSLLAPYFSQEAKLLAAEGNSLLYGRLYDTKFDPAEKKILDEVVLSVYRAPRSYTGEEMLEISCHGSMIIVQAILEGLMRIGFRLALGGEFTLRAFLNNKLDLSRAEAVQELIQARTRTAQGFALHRLGGSIERAINDIKSRIVDLMAKVSIQLDYPEDELEEITIAPEEIESLQEALGKLAKTYSSGQRYQQGVRIALAGKTNAGKSSLFNALLREDRAIVSDIPGTTRDWLEIPFDIDGIPVQLYDTAGLRETEEHVEKEGIRRTAQVLEAAALVLYVVDGTLDFGEEDLALRRTYLNQDLPVFTLWNKKDLAGWKAPPESIMNCLSLSTKTGEGLAELLEVLKKELVPEGRSEDMEVLVDSRRQYILLEQAIQALEHAREAAAAGLSLDLLALDVQDALNALGQITGEVYSEDILDRVFSGFCVGK